MSSAPALWSPARVYLGWLRGRASIDPGRSLGNSLSICGPQLAPDFAEPTSGTYVGHSTAASGCVVRRARARARSSAPGPWRASLRASARARGDLRGRDQYHGHRRASVHRPRRRLRRPLLPGAAWSARPPLWPPRRCPGPTTCRRTHMCAHASEGRARGNTLS